MAVLLTTAVLTACGGDDDKPGETPKPPRDAQAGTALRSLSAIRTQPSDSAHNNKQK
ncbi:hypothetical protein [Cupriavidus sp. H18C1]|uniref:hypothetical protein n=1 Tax=Cupriavidus sp. H18C1 TaxID=3241601 RepID=UPI003BB972E1